MELKEELEAREETKSGNKAWLRRRLYAAILREHLERHELKKVDAVEGCVAVG